MNKKQIYILAAIAIGVATIIEMTPLNHPHVYSWWHEVPGFDAIFGFFGCALLIFVAKVVLAPIIQKKEDYYVKKIGTNSLRTT